MRARDLRELDNQTLIDKLNGFKKQLFELRMKQSSSGADHPHLFKGLKRDIARILTVLRERELAEKK